MELHSDTKLTRRKKTKMGKVLSEVTKKGSHLYEPLKSVPSALLLVVLGLYLLLAFLTQLVEDEMPTTIRDADVSGNEAYTFSEEAARSYLDTILGDQPRVAGTAYHLQKTMDLKRLVDSVAGRASLPVQTDWQFADGDYWLNLNPPYVNVYQNVSNVIARLEGETNTSLLVNCHYDSVPFAMGASDDAVFCAVMMEVLSRMSRRGRRFKHSVVFLFNGAEENPLHGSHAFLQHEWSSTVTNVVNLDAVGMNGKPLLFQVSDPRLLNAYKRVVRNPSGQSVAEFLFSTGIIPSDTDFRIWREFGDIHGVDIAFIKWSHVYHTRYDHPDMLHAGVVQNAGNTLLSLISELADMEELDTQIEPASAVYYDYLYWFMVTYSFSAAVALDILTAILALCSVMYYLWLVELIWTSVVELLFATLARLSAVVAGVLVSVIFVPLMNATTSQLRYLSEPWVVVPHYWVPYLTAAVCVSQLFDSWRGKKNGLNRSIRTLQAQAATRLLMALLLLVLTCIPSFTTFRYMFTVPVFITSLFGIVSLTVVRYVRLEAWHQLIMEFLFSLPSIMFLMSICLRFNAIMLPTMGRSPVDSPDTTIAVLNVGLAILTSSTVSGVELLFSRKRMWMTIAPVAVVSLALMFIPFYPYQEEGPSVQRHYWFHTEVISYNHSGAATDRVSGVFVTRHDAYTTRDVLPALREKGIDLNVHTDWLVECERQTFCNLPVFRVGFGDNNLQEGLFLVTGPPAAFDPEPAVEVLSRFCVGQTCTFNFEMTGSAHNLVTLWPRAGVNVTSWSFNAALQHSRVLLNRPVYVVIHSIPTYKDIFQTLRFTVNFSVTPSQQSQPIVDVTHHAHKIHHPEDYTSEYRNIIDAVPKYFNIAHNLSFRKNYVF